MFDALNVTRVNAMTEEERLAKEKADAARADAEPEWAKNLSAKCDAVLKMADSMPSLVKADTETAEMAADKKKADAAKADADEKERADKARADAEEKERADKAAADSAKADAAKADAAKADAEKEKKEEEEARADSVRKAVEAATAPLRDQLLALTGAVHINDDDRAALAEAQSRADSVLRNLGTGVKYQAPQPMAGETPINYRRRLASLYKSHSDVWKTRDLSVVADSILDVAEAQIYDALSQVRADTVDVAAGTLRTIIKRDRTGREITEFTGDKRAWMGQFMSAPQLMVKLDKEA